jgi:hypothetical protein
LQKHRGEGAEQACAYEMLHGPFTVENRWQIILRELSFDPIATA